MRAVGRDKWGFRLWRAAQSNCKTRQYMGGFWAGCPGGWLFGARASARLRVLADTWATGAPSTRWRCSLSRAYTACSKNRPCRCNMPQQYSAFYCRGTPGRLAHGFTRLQQLIAPPSGRPAGLHPLPQRGLRLNLGKPFCPKACTWVTCPKSGNPAQPSPCAKPALMPKEFASLIQPQEKGPLPAQGLQASAFTPGRGRGWGLSASQGFDSPLAPRWGRA